MLTNEHQLLHTVPILRIPVAAQLLITLHHIFQFILRHGGIPLTGIAQRNLTTSLLEDVTDIFFALKVADAFSADDVLWPFAGNEVIEESEVQRATSIVDKGSNTILLSLAFIMVVMMVVVVLVFVFVIIVMVVVLVFVIIVMMVVMFFFFVIIIIVVTILQLMYPGCRRCDLVEIELAGVNQQIKVNIAIVALDDVGLRLDGTDYLTNLCQLLLGDFRGFVQQNDVAELYLLDDEVLYVLFVNV